MDRATEAILNAGGAWAALAVVSWGVSALLFKLLRDAWAEIAACSQRRGDDTAKLLRETFEVFSGSREGLKEVMRAADANAEEVIKKLDLMQLQGDADRRLDQVRREATK